MKNIHRFVGCLQQSIGGLFLIGAYTAHILKVINIFPVHNLNEMSKWNSTLVIAICAISFASIDKACEIFYTTEKYNEYTNGMMYGKGLRVPSPDLNFYPTMIGDIGFKRKIAGYVYAISKIVFCSILGAILYLGIRSIFKK